MILYSYLKIFLFIKLKIQKKLIKFFIILKKIQNYYTKLNDFISYLNFKFYFHFFLNIYYKFIYIFI